MDENRGRLGVGLLLIAIGLLVTLGKLGLGDMFGEAFVAAIGVIFLLVYALGKVEWALYPGAFTVTVGTVIFLAARHVDMEMFWPLFVIAPGVSFLIIRAASPENQWAIFPGFIVTGVGLAMLLFSSGLVSWVYLEIMEKFWPIGLILAGLWLVFKSWKSRNSADR